MRYNNKLATLAMGVSVATLLFAGVSMADGAEGSKNRKVTAGVPVAALPATPAPAAAPVVSAPVVPVAPPQPPVIYNFYFGLPTTAGVPAAPGALPTAAPATAPAGIYAAAPAVPATPVAPAAPVRSQYDTYCSSCHGNSMKNSSVSKIQSGISSSSSMRAAVGSLSTSILSAIAAGQ